MFGFRRLMYTILSRHFWIGVGVGFFLGGLFCFTNSAHAMSVSHITDTIYGNLTPGFDDYTMIIFDWGDNWCGTGVPCAQFQFDSPFTNYGYTLNTNLSFSIAPSNLANRTKGPYVAVFVDDNPNFGFPSGSNRTLSNFLITYESVIDDYFYFETQNSGNFDPICAGVAGSIDTCDPPPSGEGSDIYYPVLLFNDDMSIASTTCTLSATASDCLLHYDYSTEFTLTNIVLLTLLFAIGTMFGFWVVRTFW